MKRAVPVLYYHRVNRVDRRMAVSPELFRAQVARLKDKGFVALGMEALAAFIGGGELPAAKCVVITFDDGFADNLEHAFPVLRDAGMKAIIFIIPSRVDMSGEPRSSGLAETAFDRANKNALGSDLSDYLRASEIEMMARSGVIEFGSHTMTHKPAFNSDRIERFLLSKDPHWARQVLLEGDLRPGAPLYGSASSVAVTRFIPDPAVKEKLIGLVDKEGGWEAVKRLGKEEWTKRLTDEARRIGPGSGRFETRDEAVKRILDELKSSREAVERISGAPCTALCWPWGHHGQTGVEAAKAAGYKLAFTTESGAVRAGDDPYRLRRLRVSARTGARTLELMCSALCIGAAARLAAVFAKSTAVSQQG